MYSDYYEPPRPRSTIILTPDYFGNFRADVDLENLYYRGQKIEADALLSDSGDVIAYQPKGDITGLPPYIEPHEITHNPKLPPAPRANKNQRVTLDKEGAVI